jgi:hypothetical protein
MRDALRAPRDGRAAVTPPRRRATRRDCRRDRPLTTASRQLQDDQRKDVASALSQLAAQLPAGTLYGAGVPGVGALSLPLPLEPGPSSHPRGPPELGAAVDMDGPGGSVGDADDDGGDGDMGGLDDDDGTDTHAKAVAATAQQAARRGARSATMSNDEWVRQRKDNHVRARGPAGAVRPLTHPQKEVERRRRGNINEGINELGRIVPNGTGEKAKGAVLQRAVQYIHHLKENEARNIEKWTLEKLLMDQAMGDLQAQLEELRRAWEDERGARLRAENELDVLRGVAGHAAPGAMAAPAKRKSPDGDGGAADDAKRQRVE